VEAIVDISVIFLLPLIDFGCERLRACVVLVENMITVLARDQPRHFRRKVDHHVWVLDCDLKNRVLHRSAWQPFELNVFIGHKVGKQNLTGGDAPLLGFRAMVVIPPLERCLGVRAPGLRQVPSNALDIAVENDGFSPLTSPVKCSFGDISAVVKYSR
jgi:hypothetical protein